MMRQKLLSLAIMLICGVSMALGQTSQVKGLVVDEVGEPIIGATIKAIGAEGVGTISNAEGRFELNSVPQSVTALRVTYLGMENVEVKISANVRVVMVPQSKDLDQVLVTAFGTAKKSAFTGSATVIGAEEIEKRPLTTVTQALEGKVTGLEINPSTSPGSSSSMVVRGQGSIDAGIEPLIVLDGIPYDGSWNTINPSDVESITVLKDAASNALYGARGANGVIQITTKKAQHGQSVVTFNSKWSSNSRGIPSHKRITSPVTYMETQYAGYRDYFINEEGMTPEMAHAYANATMIASKTNGGLAYNPFSYPDGEDLIGMDGKINPNATLGREVNGYWIQPDDWEDATFKHGLRQEYDVNFASSHDQGSLYGSFGYVRDKGIVVNSNFERYTGRLKGEWKVKPYLTMGGNASYAHSIRNNVNNENYTSSYFTPFSNAINMAPIYPLYIRNADKSIMMGSFGRMYDYGDGENAGLVRPNAPNYNALAGAYYDKNRIVVDVVTANGFMDIKFLKDFKFTLNAGINMDTERANFADNPYQGQIKAQGGILQVAHDRTTSYNIQQLLNYNKSIGKHNISALIGHENYRYRYEFLSGMKTKAAMYETNKELNGWLNSRGTPESYVSNYNTEGYFMQGLYDYDQRYFGSVSYRRDASSRLAPGNRWGNFWSLGGGWLINRESWFDVEWVDMLKLKANYGVQGNDAIGNFRYEDVYSINNQSGEVAYSLTTKGNKDITWESTGNFSAGIEFGFWKGRLNGELDFYNRKTKDMLYFKRVATSIGYSGYYDNIGDMRNRGVELSLDGSVIRTKQIEWKLNMNMTHNKNKVTMLPEELKQMDMNGHLGYQDGMHFIAEGLPLGTWYLKDYAGVDKTTGESLWYDEDGNTTNSFSEARYTTKGDYNSKVFGGFGTTLNAYGVDFAMQFTYGLGGKVFDETYAYLMSCPDANYLGGALHQDILKAWSPTNPNSNIPRFQFGDSYTGSYSTRWLTSAKYLSLQNIQVGYTLPRKIVAKARLSRVRAYISADNVWLWSARRGLDPRFGGGIQTYSVMRSITGGLTVQF